MKKRFKIDVDVYGVTVEFFINYKSYRVISILNNKLSKMGADEIFIRTDVDAQTFSYTPYYAVWFQELDDCYDFLIHELFHIVYLILDDKGLKLSDDSDEAYAYLMQYIYAEFIHNYNEK